MDAGFAAKNSKLVLKTNDVKLAGIEESRGAHVVVDGVVLDLKGDRLGIVVGLTVVVHGDNARLDVGP